MMLCTAVTTLLLSSAVAQDAPASAEPTVVAAWKGDLRSTIDLKGTIVPVEAARISLWLDRYRDELLILEVAPHGDFVNAGDVLIRFDTRKIEEQIHKAEFDLHQAERRLAHTEEEGRIQQEADHAELERAAKDAEWASRRLEAHRTKEAAFKLEDVRLRLQSTQHNIEDQRDELEQLEKMYREDELVDATEEIVLKRSRRRLATSMAWAKLGKAQSDHELSHAEALKAQGLELDANQKAAALARKQRSVAIKQESRDAALERSRFDLHEQTARLEHLRQDRERLTVRAPRAGLVIHGDAEASPGTGTLDRGSRASLFKTIMTVAGPDRLMVVTGVPERVLFRAKTGSAAEITPAAAPDFTTIGSLRVVHLPTGKGSDGENVYRAEITMEKGDPRLRPGMKCTVAVVDEQAHDVVLIPKGAVIARAEGSIVWCAESEQGEFVERRVVLGPSDDENVVVEEGLSAGEFVRVSEGSGA